MNKYDAFLIKYAEIGIKGKNRHVFEEALVRQIRIALRPCEGRFAVSRTYGRVFVEAHSDYGALSCVRHLGDLPCRGPRPHAAPRPVQDGCGFHAGGVSGRDPYL